MVISDEELLNLPDDPELAFVQFEDSLRKKLYSEIAAANDEYTEDLRRNYVDHVLAAAKAFDIVGLRDWHEPPLDDRIYGFCNQLMSEVTGYTVQIRIRDSRRVKRYSVALDSSAKQKIRYHLGKIKETADRLEISQSKKEALFSKISALEDEVNRDRTRFDAVMALILETANIGGEAAKRLEPVRKFIESITGLIKEAKDDEEKQFPRLEGPQERKRIEGPHKKITASKNEKPQSDLDDEIPF